MDRLTLGATLLLAAAFTTTAVPGAFALEPQYDVDTVSWQIDDGKLTSLRTPAKYDCRHEFATTHAAVARPDVVALDRDVAASNVAVSELKVTCISLPNDLCYKVGASATSNLTGVVYAHAQCGDLVIDCASALAAPCWAEIIGIGTPPRVCHVRVVGSGSGSCWFG